MMSIIKGLWYGNICSQEDNICTKPEFMRLINFTTRHCGELEATLTDKRKDFLTR